MSSRGGSHTPQDLCPTGHLKAENPKLSKLDLLSPSAKTLNPTWKSRKTWEVLSWGRYMRDRIFGQYYVPLICEHPYMSHGVYCWPPPDIHSYHWPKKAYLHSPHHTGLAISELSIWGVRKHSVSICLLSQFSVLPQLLAFVTMRL